MNHTVRRLWGIAVVGGAVAVGVTTRDAAFTVLTLAGGLVLPRILGLGGHHHGGRFACGGGQGRRRIEDRLQEWHRQAHGDAPAPPATTAV